MKVKENVWPCPSWLLVNMAPSANSGVASLTIECGAESWFVQVTVDPFGTVTDAGTKAKFWTATETARGGDGVVGTAVVVAGGTVVVVWAMVVVVTTIVSAVVAGGDVTTGVAWVVTGTGPEGVAQPAMSTAARMAAPTTGYQVLKVRVLMEFLT